MKSIFDNILTVAERKHLKHVGINKLLKPRCHFTNLERKYYLMLKELNIFYIPQYELEGRFYDAYLPDHNILLEFDGAFWHPLNEKECKYDFQRKSMEVDKLKNKIARKKGMKIIRIRENEPITTCQLKELIWG